MKLSDFNLSEQNRVLKWAIGVLITILLGAIGSGLWERVLSGIVDRFSHFLLSLLASLFHGYVDFLHNGIGNGIGERLILLPYLIFTSLLLISPWVIFGLLNERVNKRLRKNTLQDKPDKSLTNEEFDTKTKKQRKFFFFYYSLIHAY